MTIRILKKLKTPILTLAILLVTAPLYAFESSTGPPGQSQPFLKEIGLITGYGRASMPEGKYETIPIILHCGVDLSKYFSGLRGHRGLLTAYIEPQVNPVISPESDIEFGVGVGLQYQYPVTTFLSLYVNASTGPYYISVDTTDQADGFIFANYAGAGAYFFVNKNTAVNAGYRFRHMSNANTREPNGGIDSHFGVIGISWFY
jgi:lipid A 3-O-deacylase